MCTGNSKNHVTTLCISEYLYGLELALRILLNFNTKIFFAN